MPSDTPLFSIVIPTRNRGHLLPSALRSALEQAFDDFEVVVVANNCVDGTREVVRDVQDSRVRYFETSTTLSMPDNWEYAWTKARGSYVVYLADDDALVPTALSTLADRAIGDTPEIVVWDEAMYYYPDWHDPHLQNLLILNAKSRDLIEDAPADSYRKMCAQFSFPWQSTLPKMLNCAAHRETFEAWRSSLGKLFGPVCPDYWFAWTSTHLLERIRVLHRPLTIHGISDDAIGSNAGLHEAGATFRKEFADIDLYAGLPTRAPISMNLIAATFLRATAVLEEQGIAHEPFNRQAYLLAVAKQLRERESEDLLNDRAQHFPELIAAAASISAELRDTIDDILAAPSPPVAETESIRDVRIRTARMAREYGPTLQNATRDHLGDDECARCVLGLADGVLADASWDTMYVFGEELGIADPHSAGKGADRLYDLLLRCRERRQDAHARARPEASASAPAANGAAGVKHGEAGEALRDELWKKDLVIAELRAAADRDREETEALTAQLKAKERQIAHLTVAANERLRLAEQASADAERARAQAEQFRTELLAKEKVIGELSRAAAERLELIEQLSRQLEQRGAPAESGPR